MDAHVAISDQILTSLAKRLKLEVSKIQPQHSLRHDLGLDSADSIELIFALEEMFDIEVSDQDFRKMNTVSEVIQYVRGRLQHKGGML
jgi:acyl carrier protein